ncbi:MAG: DUF4279 domain-containing protein [Candidatus Gracilibacteria bacterium]|nr:DUF4279 domain-containing protein [Candidatus Gracilibacteria bacterium]
MNKLIVELSIFSENIHYDQISDILGLKYDKYCKKGGKINDSKVGAINDEFIWVKNSGVKHSEEDLNKHIIGLINIFNKLKDKLIILKNNGCRFQIAVIYYYYGNNPGLNIDNKNLGELWNLGIDIDFDIYSLSD